MNIAALNFRLVKGAVLYNCSGILIYKHKATGKCFVRGLKNCRQQRSKNNYPAKLKTYLKTNPSEVVIFLAEIPRSTREALHLSIRSVGTELSERGLLFKEECPKAHGIYRLLNGEHVQPHTVFSMTHTGTGAVFYFHEEKNSDYLVRVQHRLKTFNNYALKDIVNPNRSMHFFSKANYPLHIEDWVLRDLGLDLIGEKAAKAHITKLSKNSLEAGEVVLNRICDMDALYYRNCILKVQPQMSMDEYLAS